MLLNMSLIEKMCNKLGYYRPASGKYYLSKENNINVVVDEKQFKEVHKFDYNGVKQATTMLLTAMGQDISRPGLVETPRRVAGYWKELLEGENYTNQEIADMFRKDFQVSFDPIVFKECKNVFSHCEHHLALMFNGTVYVAYIPTYWNGKDNSDGYRVIGLSKIPRIVDMCSKRLQLQEKLVADIAECIELATGSTQVYVEAILDHGCVSARGAKSSGITETTYMSPALRNNKEARREIQNKVIITKS